MLSFKSKVFLEAQACLKLAIPLAAAQLSEIATGFTDTVMMGLLGSKTLAAGALGSTTFIALLWTSSGMVSAVGVLCAIAFGASQLQRIRNKDTRYPLLISLLAYGIGLGSGYLMGIYWHWGSIGLWFGLVIGLLGAAVSLIWRFYRKTVALLESGAIAIPEN